MKRFLKLLEKDWRLNRAPVIGLLVLALLPYVMTKAILFYMGQHMQERKYPLHDLQAHQIRYVAVWSYFGPHSLMYNDILSAISFGAMITILMSPIFGACAFAIERRDRSAEFLAMLPVGRRTIVRSKFFLAAFLLISMALFQALLERSLLPWEGLWLPTDARSQKIAIYGSWPLQFSLGLAMFGISWFLSSFLKSPAIAAAIAIAAAFLATTLLAIWSDDFASGEYSLIYANCAVGLLCLLIGNIYYIRRVAP
jgi:ABC-type transport system involved in multi-copper enzyme maturation permease subunit